MTAVWLPIYADRVSIRALRMAQLPFLSWLSTQSTSPESTADEVLNKILAADPQFREETCLDYIRKLCASGDLQSAANLPPTLIRKRIFLGCRAYDYLMEAADRENDLHLLSQAFRDLHVSRGSVGLNSYLIVARALGKHDDSDTLLNFVVQVYHMRLNRVGIILNRIIFSLAKCGHVDKALLVFNHMKSSTHKPDLVSYNTVLSIFGRLGRVDEMLRELECLKRVGLVPDVVTYNTILNSLRKMGRLDICLRYFKEMTDREIQPDVITFKALIESLGRSGNIEQALRIFDDMNRRGIQPSIRIYRALVYSLNKMGKFDLALRFSAEMKNLQVPSVVPRDNRCSNE